MDLSRKERLPAAIEEQGLGPFISRRIYRLYDGSRHAWQSRHHRKGLRVFEPLQLLPLPVLIRLGLWRPRDLNWWIGVIFAFGSALFAAACVRAIGTSLGRFHFRNPNLIQSLDPNLIFFAGSIPFTAAAYLQLFQAANAGDPTASGQTPKHRAVFGWKPGEIGWLSCALQFLGTLLFNANTFNALLPGLGWLQQDLAVWIPDFVGSILFLASGYLAFGETCHTYWAWKPQSLSWWITFTNLLGCVAFMISAFFAFVPKEASPFNAALVSLFFTLLGAFGFLAGSLLMMAEASDAASHGSASAP
jgi:hypothetical protein